MSVVHLQNAQCARLQFKALPFHGTIKPLIQEWPDLPAVKDCFAELHCQFKVKLCHTGGMLGP